MTFGDGSLLVTACQAGARTILERVRYDGISRCSRAFPSGNAALVVLSQLGPGVVRGDSVSTTGRLRSGAHLIVTNQTATRLMGGARRSLAQATWQLEENAILELVGEPLLASAGARHEASIGVDLEAGSVVLFSDVARVGTGGDVRLRTSVRQFGRELFFDAFDAAASAPQTVGTFALVGLEAAGIAPVLAALDRTSDRLGALRVGVGALPRGIVARVLASDVWAVRAALITLRESAWAALMARRT